MVQHLPTTDSAFHFPTERQPHSSDWVFNHPLNDTVWEEFFPNAPFWRTSLGQSISDYGTTTTKLEPYVITPLRKSLYMLCKMQNYSRNISIICGIWEKI